MDAYWGSIAIFLISYAFVVSEKIEKSIVVCLGAFLLILLDIVDFDLVVSFIDFNTIGLLCGMMILVAIMKRTGMFEYVAVKAIKLSAGNLVRLLVLFAVITAVLSALLDNVTTVLIVAPITLALADVAGLNPVPFLLEEIFASNIGGTATLIGDPPNVIIGSNVGLSFVDFLSNNLPIVVLLMVFSVYVVMFFYRKELKSKIDLVKIYEMFDEKKILGDKVFIIKSILVFLLAIVLFVTHDIHHIGTASIAIGCGFLLLLISGESEKEIFKEIESTSLFFLVGIFILVGALEYMHVLEDIAKQLMHLTKGSLLMSSMVTIWFSGVCSAFLDNIPLTTLMIPMIKSLNANLHTTSQTLWWSLSLGACLGGNGTVVGAAANIIVINIARKNNQTVTFKSFFVVAFPLMLGTLIISTAYIYLRYFIFA